MRFVAVFHSAARAGAMLLCLSAGDALAGGRDPLVIPGIGPRPSARPYAAPRYAPGPRYQARTYARVRPAPAPVNPYDDDGYRPAAFNAADPYPPPPRPFGYAFF